MSTAPWNFDSDVIIDDTVLYAQWLEPSDLVSITVKPKSGATFTAGNPLNINQIIVEAVFKCKLPDGTEQTMDPVSVLLDTTNTTFAYIGNSSAYDTVLHVNKNGDGTSSVDITYKTTIDGVAKSATARLTITVDPITLSTDSWTFDNDSFVYDGTAKSIAGVGALDGNITGVNYVYLAPNGSPIDPSQVINIGTYTVIAEFTTVSDDYTATPRRATLTIVAAKTEVTVTWDSLSFVYNGLNQCPTPTFTDSSGTVLNLAYTIAGADNAINVDTYNITLSLTTSGYSIKAGQDTATFNITKAVLPAPTLKEGDIIYKGAYALTASIPILWRS